MNSNIAHIFARVFATAAGQEILTHLKSLTLNRALPPDVSDAQLRFLEGQRYLVCQIETLIKQGKEQF